MWARGAFGFLCLLLSAGPSPVGAHAPAGVRQYTRTVFRLKRAWGGTGVAEGNRSQDGLRIVFCKQPSQTVQAGHGASRPPTRPAGPPPAGKHERILGAHRSLPQETTLNKETGANAGSGGPLDGHGTSQHTRRGHIPLGAARPARGRRASAPTPRPQRARSAPDSTTPKGHKRGRRGAHALQQRMATHLSRAARHGPAMGDAPPPRGPPTLHGPLPTGSHRHRQPLAAAHHPPTPPAHSCSSDCPFLIAA